jgi:hypothetical protein
MRTRLILSALALMGALVAGAAATGSASRTPHKAIMNPDGGFGRGYGLFHSYGWARGTAGYGDGACYWHPKLCAKDDD